MAQNKTDHAYNLIKNKILTNELKPGEKIVETELTQMLNVSRTPIRAALAMLENEKLIETQSRNATIVSKLSADGFIEVYDVYENLEMLAVKLATLQGPEGKQELMMDLIHYKNNLLQNKSYSLPTFLQKDRDFHHTIWDMSKNKILISQLERLNEIYKRYIYFFDIRSMPGREIAVLDEHIRILDAIQQRNVEEAILRIQLHLRLIREHIVLRVASMSQ